MEQNSSIRNVNNELNGFCGTTQYYRHSLSCKLFTDGIFHLRDAYRCYWLVDDVLLYADMMEKKGMEFQSWKLKRNAPKEGHEGEKSCAFTLTCEDGNYNVAMRIEISSSDFDGDELVLYYTGGVLLLPSEY